MENHSPSSSNVCVGGLGSDTTEEDLWTAVSMMECDMLVAILGIGVVECHEKYLGLPCFTGRKKKDVFAEEDVAAILSIPIGRDQVLDSIQWHFDPTGSYTVKSGYRLGCSLWSDPSSSDSGFFSSISFAWWKSLWKLHIPNKVKVFVWKACNNMLPSFENLARRRIPVLQLCPLCKSASESIMHGLWSCSYLKKLRAGWSSQLEVWSIRNVAVHYPKSSREVDILEWARCYITEFHEAREVRFSQKIDATLMWRTLSFQARCADIRLSALLADKIIHSNIYEWVSGTMALSLGYMSGSPLITTAGSPGNSKTPVKEDSVSDSLRLSALFDYGNHRLPRQAKQLHARLVLHSVTPDNFLASKLVTFYSKSNSLIQARHMFDKISQKSIFSYNAMLIAYSSHDMYADTLKLFSSMLLIRMLDSSLRPDGVTVISVLQACGQSNDLVFGMEVHNFIIENEIQMDLWICNALIGLYAKCGSLDYARSLFEEMSERDEVSYNTIISGYMVHGFVDRAMDLFREMKQPALSTWNAVISGLVQNNQHEGILDLVREMVTSGLRPNAVTLSTILSMFSYFSNLKGGKEMHGYAVKNGYDRNIYVATAIIDNYAKAGFLTGAQQVFDQSKSRSLVIWTAIISACAAHGDADMAFFLFNEMLNNGIQPDPVTFTAVLAGCAHSGLVDKAREIFDSMSAEYGIQPSVEHYACMVGVLSRARRLSEAAEFISNMPIEPSAKVWGALLNGASVSGDVELGKFVCDRLFEIEPENTGNYIIMANLYSQAGRWEEADMVRRKMDQIGLKKVAGSSWIESSGGLHSFIAKDTSSEQTEEMYKVLEGLLGMMREEGYVLQDDIDVDSSGKQATVVVPYKIEPVYSIYVNQEDADGENNEVDHVLFVRLFQHRMVVNQWSTSHLLNIALSCLLPLIDTSRLPIRKIQNTGEEEGGGAAAAWQVHVNVKGDNMPSQMQ
ncbi:hypothetical protein EZV62_016915 [Acer yangbiense]|uniref:Reverse transcriptase zinc-binding domain-containing protein n=1 Tax=Acer yangbiense TaxID=1000413 RepID=A0A5C7HS52_9ROSI|nr:hypothetical protein EZV62_016915 [Acer yangbiense]